MGLSTNYLAHKLLDLVYGGQAFTAPASLYVGLSLQAERSDGVVTEPTGGSYARVAVTNDLTKFPAAANRQKANAALIQFPAPTGAWGTILSFFIADASSGGNVLVMANLATPIAVASGAPAPKFAIGALLIQFS